MRCIFSAQRRHARLALDDGLNNTPPLCRLLCRGRRTFLHIYKKPFMPSFQQLKNPLLHPSSSTRPNILRRPSEQSRDTAPVIPSPSIQNQAAPNNMKSLTVSTILCALSAISVAAERGLSCGYHLVNSGGEFLKFPTNSRLSHPILAP